MTQETKRQLFNSESRERVQLATTYWLFRFISLLLGSSILTLILLRTIRGELPVAAWQIIWVLLLTQLVVIIVVAVDGYLDDKQRVRVEAMEVVMLLAVLLAGLTAYWQNVIEGQDDAVYYLGYGALALLVMLAVVLTHLFERKTV